MSNAMPDQLDLQRFLVVLRRRGWLILLLTLAAGAAAFAFSKHQTKEYTATASILFSEPQVGQEASGLATVPSQYIDEATIMATNVSLLAQEPGVAAATARLVGHGLTASAVSSDISATQQGQTTVANVAAMTPSPRLSAAIANTYVEQFISAQTNQSRTAVAQALALVDRQIAALSPVQRAGPTGQALVDRAESLRILASLQDGGAQLAAAASVPRTPSSPKVKRNTGLGLLLGLLLGSALALLLERFDRRIRTTEDLEAAYDLPLLASIPYDRSYAKIPDSSDPQSHARHEVFRLLRAYLRYFDVDRKVKTLMVVSAAPGDGKTTVARNLAYAAAETGSNTLLIETDLRRPTVARDLQLSPSRGLSEVLIKQVEPDEAVLSLPVSIGSNGSGLAVASLDVLVAGQPPPNPAELVQSEAMTGLLSWAAARYDFIVIDTPPLAVVSDAFPLLRQVDGVVLVSQLGKNKKDAAGFLRRQIARANAPLLGVIANGVKSKRAGEYEYAYYRAAAVDDKRDALEHSNS